MQGHVPVRLAMLGLHQASFHVINIDQFDEKWPVKYRPQVNAYFGATDFDHVGLIAPFGILETNVLSNDDRMTSEIDVELPVDDKFAAGFFADPALKLRFEDAQIRRPQPDQGECQQCDKRDCGPKDDFLDFHEHPALSASDLYWTKLVIIVDLTPDFVTTRVTRADFVNGAVKCNFDN